MTALASAGTIWPVNPVVDSKLYYAKDVKLVKVDTSYVETAQGSKMYRMAFTPTYDTIMAPKTVMKIGDVTILLPEAQVGALRAFLKESLATKEMSPDVTVCMKWLITDEGKKK